MQFLSRALTTVGLFAASLLGSHGVQHHPATAPRRYAVIIVLDGARPDFLQTASMPHYRWLVEHGASYTQAFVGQEIAITPTSHATIGTGVFPRHHGVQGFWWKDPRTGWVTRPTDSGPVQSGALEAVITQHHAPTLAGALKAQDPSARIISSSGHKCYASDAMGTVNADYILCSLIYHDRWVAQAVGTHRPPPGAINNPAWDVPIPNPDSGMAPAVEQWNLGSENDWTVAYTLWAFKRVHYPRLVMINLPETDVMGHFAGTTSPVFKTLRAHFDRELGQIIGAYRQAGLLSRTDIVLTSDHGMEAAQSRLPFSDLDRAIQLAHATKVFLEADMGAVLGIRELNKARAVARNAAMLGGSSIDATLYKVQNHGTWMYRFAYARSDLPYELRQAYVTLADTAAAPDGPDVVVDYAPGITTGDRPARGYHWVAGHLGPSWPDQHVPMVIEGPGVHSGVKSQYPARLVDVAPTVERLLGLKVAGDGVVLEDALTSTDPTGRSRQAVAGRQLTPIVRALEARAGSL